MGLITRITRDGIRFDIDGGNTWKPFSCQPDDTIDSIRYIMCNDNETSVDYDYANYYNMFQKYYLGKFKEEINMNKVLELYKEREEKRIKEKYGKLKEDMYNDNFIVKEFKELEEKTKQSYEELCNKYNTEEVHYINRTGYGYESGYELSTNIMNDIHEKLAPDFNKEMEELHDKVRDIEALLSISDDKDYRLEVLKNYGLLDKKGSIVR